MLTVVAAALWVGTGTAHAMQPWENHCVGHNARPAEKRFVIQACQRAYSAVARAEAITSDVRTETAEAAAARAEDAASAAEAVEAAATVASTASSITTTADDAGAALITAADDARTAAKAAEGKPLDVTIANKAAEAEDKAARATTRKFPLPSQDKIPRLTNTQ
ncbi:hypothetical protein ABZ942_04100 [Nocardia sp. NPDC046473]|uniref:hypothetical protein n=1 Tax=Nocardia sp. NPDC046473 TaxID=3155733 RepID=UPI0033EC0E3D